MGLKSVINPRTGVGLTGGVEVVDDDKLVAGTLGDEVTDGLAPGIF